MRLRRSLNLPHNRWLPGNLKTRLEVVLLPLYDMERGGFPHGGDLHA